MCIRDRRGGARWLCGTDCWMEDQEALDEVSALKKANAELLEHLQFRNDAEDKEVRELFPEIPQSEHVIDYFACALSAKILLQGWMYVTQNHLLFSCNLLVYKTCLLYTSDAADDLLCVDLGGRRIIKKKKYI
eukprot:TRINITY_DN953_c0_g1_i1.p1 TRINITY_DN953_c0_g1~~TRINITY_DN953_c0_g1_i1.p1  ORF type:complete len:133 (+),score=44.46 TRINITY_DN953_c0_g1_i1:116-514(+)